VYCTALQMFVTIWCPSIDNFGREPGRQPGVLLLPLHSTLLPPKSLGTTDTTRTLISSLPPLNPPPQCVSRQDEDNHYARGSILTPGVLSSEMILVWKDSMEALLWTVRTWWLTPSPPTAGIMVGTFGYLCALKPWSSTFPTTAVGTLGGTSGDPCVITR